MITEAVFKLSFASNVHQYLDMLLQAVFHDVLHLPITDIKHVLHASQEIELLMYIALGNDVF